jgi:hypothetical protein
MPEDFTQYRFGVFGSVITASKHPIAIFITHRGVESEGESVL